MEQHLVELLAWIEPRALLLALGLPPVIRVVGHWIPEELFMISMGVLAARAATPTQMLTLLAAVMLSHFVTDQVVYLIGRFLRPRLNRYRWIGKRLEMVTNRLEASPAAVYGMIPGRVFPIGRGAWMMSCGVVGLPWRRYVMIDVLALLAHLVAWSGLGWWLAGDLSRLESSAEVGKTLATWLGAALIAAIAGLVAWRTRPRWQPAGAHVVRTVTRPFRVIRK